ncbi:MAG TPA: NAD-dependent epimerase/dehydratase family protein, partial [Roseiflexaceae bacterium]|nr:NAD-dependent epimerase/dehydratase family protein [Roseiflexaceae bacterium]
MKVLVTGGAGYIGSICTAELLAAGHEAVVFDNLYQGHRAAVPPEAAFCQGDLRNADDVARVFREHSRFDAIMHFASFTLVGESMQSPAMYLRDNIVAGANLLEQAVAHGVSRFILSSTANLF